MAYAHRVNRVSMIGTMYNGGEIWSTSFYAGATGGDAPEPTDAMAEMVADEWQPFFTSTSTVISYLWKTTMIKITPIGANGVIDVPKIKTYAYPTAIEGNHTGNGFPPQCSVVATLIADSGVGIGGKGRMYLPGVASGLDNTGHIGTTVAAALASGLATFFSNVGASLDAPGLPINASKGTPTTTGLLAINRVLTTVRVGTVYDTQRRRRNALAENYQSDTI